jgi:two-component system chemotaxis response regulator CheY
LISFLVDHETRAFRPARPSRTLENDIVNIDQQKEKLAAIRTLIVDDNAVDRRLVRLHLEDIGIKVIHEAVDGGDGIFKVENAREMSRPFHLIITDWKMPKKDGLAFLKTLRDVKVGPRVFVIMLTAVADLGPVKAALASGIDDYVVKPLVKDQLKLRILGALDKISV